MDQRGDRDVLLRPLPPRNLQGVQRGGGGEDSGEDQEEAERGRRRREQRQTEEAGLLGRRHDGGQLLPLPRQLCHLGNVRD